ncbi:NADH-quinone oxidoreductase subunit H [Botrimarina colliarenosi]|uniref:NADH-quinone oxidoreductase subunit H n=1 Tax=Botrimarina colliarenosi TaxID=2528001 RepID=A0A5C6APA2_9BACT|nr:complex I subunit 1 family protein [Botrimarina colliarenosi]TWU00004.1 NADH-quinone oxidoreductase subunit H [Botrimarina colliarenosi]
MAPTINWALDLLVGWVGLSIPPDAAVGYVLAALVQVGMILNLAAVGGLVFIWLERKIAGRIQDRLGPTRVGGRFGWLQTVADGLKLLTKEDLMPTSADSLLFRVAPYIGVAASVAAFVALPFAGGPHPFVVQRLDIAVFFVLAVLGLEVFSIILAGYSSASKWSLFGAMREAAQVVSYEVPLGLCAVVPVMLAGSMDLVTVGDVQRGGFWNWHVLNDPFTLIVFCVYFTCATASVNRAPFDLAEAESELVGGFHTEYSGMRWSFFFLAEYSSMLLVSLLAAILFLGAWHGPVPLGMNGEGWLGSVVGLGVANYLGNLLGLACLMTKGVFLVIIMMWVRWSMPRLRIDQVMTTCLKYCTPLAAVCFLGATAWQAAFPAGLLWRPPTPGLVEISEQKTSPGGAAARSQGREPLEAIGYALPPLRGFSTEAPQ